MAFVVEDGTGLSNANAYVDVAFANTYHTDRCHATWRGPDTAKEGAIVQATEWLDLSVPFQGERKTDTQALEWPRESVFDDDTEELVADDAVPARIQQATAELALFILTNPGALYGSESPSLARRRQRAGGIEVETEFAGTSNDLPVIRKVKKLVRKLSKLGGGGSQEIYRL